MYTISMKKVFKNSGNLFSFILASIVTLIAMIGVMIFESETPWIIYFFAGLFVVEFITVLLIIRNFLSFKRDLEMTKAIVSLTWYARSRKMIVFTYKVAGVEYKKTNALLSRKSVRAIKKGDELEICYKINNPSKALIKDIYFMN
jgi:uncharacterized membrane protein